MRDLTVRWMLISAELRDAARALPTNGVSLAEFEEFLSQNELELAWDSLAEAAGRRAETTLVWFHLAEAAALMELPDHKERAVRRMIETWPAKDSPYRLGYVLAKPDARPA